MRIANEKAHPHPACYETGEQEVVEKGDVREIPAIAFVLAWMVGLWG